VYSIFDLQKVIVPADNEDKGGNLPTNIDSDEDEDVGDLKYHIHDRNPDFDRKDQILCSK